MIPRRNHPPKYAFLFLQPQRNCDFDLFQCFAAQLLLILFLFLFTPFIHHIIMTDMYEIFVLFCKVIGTKQKSYLVVVTAMCFIKSIQILYLYIY